MNSILNIAGIVALISGSISLLGVALSSYFNYMENRTNRYVQLITNQTLQNNLLIRNNSEIITVFTRPEIIDDARVRCDKEYKIKLMTAEVNIEHHFKYAMKQEKLMIEVLRVLVKCAFQYFDDPTDELNAELRRLGEEYYEMMTIYDYADWLYIKSQAKSKAYNKQFFNFNIIYEEVNNDFKKDDIPMPW